MERIFKKYSKDIFSEGKDVNFIQILLLVDHTLM